MSSVVDERPAPPRWTRPPWRGRVLRRSLGWGALAVSFPLLLVGFWAAFCAVVPIDEHVAAPALVRMDGRLDVTAHDPGTLTRLDVHPGERVAAGTLIATFFMEPEQVDVWAKNAEWELELRRFLRNPNDQAAHQRLVTLDGERRLAQRVLGQREIRAPRAGVIRDVRGRAGQRLAAGDLICTIIPADARPILELFVPGRVRAQLRPGTQVRLELVGQRYHYYDATIRSIDDEIIGAKEAHRELGPAYSHATVQASVVRADADFAERPRDLADGLYDGAQGTAQIRLQRHSILAALARALKQPHVD